MSSASSSLWHFHLPFFAPDVPDSGLVPSIAWPLRSRIDLPIIHPFPIQTSVHGVPLSVSTSITCLRIASILSYESLAMLALDSPLDGEMAVRSARRTVSQGPLLSQVQSRIQSLGARLLPFPTPFASLGRRAWSIEPLHFHTPTDGLSIPRANASVENLLTHRPALIRGFSP